MASGLTRREAGRLAAAAGATAMIGTSAQAAASALPSLSPAFSVTVTLSPPIEMGMVPAGRRRFIAITGGTVSGPLLNGVVLPGGGDWQTIGPDGTTELRAHYAMRASDGTVVEIDNPGVRVASPDVIARLTAGEDLDPALYYFRTSPRFSLPPGKHDWLRRNVFVGVGIRHPDTVELQVYKLS